MLGHQPTATATKNKIKKITPPPDLVWNEVKLLASWLVATDWASLEDMLAPPPKERSHEPTMALATMSGK